MNYCFKRGLLLNWWYHFTIITLLTVSSSALLSDNFRQFLRQRFGDATEALLTRQDMGPGGSLGGGNHIAGRPTEKRPVILVHGITNIASTFSPIQHYFLTQGYHDSEVYGTTYGDGGKTNVLFVTMQCHYVKVVRMLIQAVAEYANSRVNILAYSMGSPIARKAIKGGVCVDTNEQLGPPLTGLVYTFVGVAGANFGSFLCAIPFGSCNLQNGMGCGSAYLNEINSGVHYEGTYVYTIYSTGDEKVGYRACGRLTSSINGENQAFVKNGLSHDQVMLDTAQLQHNLVTYNKE